MARRSSFAPRAPLPLLVIAASIAASVTGSTALGGCTKDEPKPEAAKPRAPQPVPSGFVFNDFIPQAGGEVAPVDGAAPPALAGLDASAPAPQDAPAAGGRARAKLVQAGAAPLVVRAYRFAKGAPERRTVTYKVGIRQAGQQAQQPPVRLALDFTVKEARPDGARLEAKVTKADLVGANLPPQQVAEAQKQLAAVAGISAEAALSSRGEVGEVAFGGGAAAAKSEAAQEILPLLQQTMELVVVAFPEEPIGQGASWEEDLPPAAPGGAPGKAAFSLKEVRGDLLVVDVKVERPAERAPLDDPRAPKGSMRVTRSTGSFTYELRLDRVASKVRGEVATDLKVEAPDPKQAGKLVPVIEQSVVMHQELDTPGAGAR